MEWSGVRIRQHLVELQETTNNMADVLYAIHSRMEGRGVNPAESPLVVAKLREIELRLRQLGANHDDPIPSLGVISNIKYY